MSETAATAHTRLSTAPHVMAWCSSMVGTKSACAEGMWGTINCTAAVRMQLPCQYSTHVALAAIFLTAVHRVGTGVGLGLL